MKIGGECKTIVERLKRVRDRSKKAQLEVSMKRAATTNDCAQRGEIRTMMKFTSRRRRTDGEKEGNVVR